MKNSIIALLVFVFGTAQLSAGSEYIWTFGPPAAKQVYVPFGPYMEVSVSIFSQDSTGIAQIIGPGSANLIQIGEGYQAAWSPFPGVYFMYVAGSGSGVIARASLSW